MSSHSKQGVGEFLGDLDVRIDLPLATVGSRALANILDYLLFLFTFMAVALLGTLAVSFLPDVSRGLGMVFLVVTFFLLFWGFFFLLEWWGDGQSPGKRMASLRVVGDGGGAARPAELLLRNLGRLIDMLPGFYGVGVLVMLIHPRGKRLGDLLAGTVVVREEAAKPALPPRHWPTGMSAEEIAIVEGYFARAVSLTMKRREQLGAKLLHWLSLQYPGFAQPAEGEAPFDCLTRAFISEGQ